jgi:hypothetical protein
MEPEGSKPNSQELSTYPYPEPDQSSPTVKDSSLSTHLRFDLPSGLVPSGITTSNL